MSDVKKNASSKMFPATGFAGLLSSERVKYGTLMVCTHPRFAQMLKAVCKDVEFVFLDTEHMPQDRGDLARTCAIYSGLGIPTLVRVPKACAVMARAVIDAGATGVIASYIETVAQVRELVAAVKLKPLQGELLELALDDPAKFEKEHPKTAKYVRDLNAGRALVLNIESAKSIRDYDKLLAVPGVDAVLVGPHDLSVSLGVPEDFASEKFQNALKTIFTKARAAGVGAGIHQGQRTNTPGMTPEYAIKWINEYGCNVYVHSGDINLFATLLDQQLKMIRKNVEEKLPESAIKEVEAKEKSSIAETLIKMEAI